MDVLANSIGRECSSDLLKQFDDPGVLKIGVIGLNSDAIFAIDESSPPTLL